MDKATIISGLQANRKQLKNFGVKKLGLFGSYARNCAGEDSDVDLLVFFETGKKNLNNLLDTHHFLENLFGHKTELITEESLSHEFKELILKDMIYVGI